MVISDIGFSERIYLNKSTINIIKDKIYHSLQVTRQKTIRICTFDILQKIELDLCWALVRFCLFISVLECHKVSPNLSNGDTYDQ